MVAQGQDVNRTGEAVEAAGEVTDDIVKNPLVAGSDHLVHYAAKYLRIVAGDHHRDAAARFGSTAAGMIADPSIREMSDKIKTWTEELGVYFRATLAQRRAIVSNRNSFMGRMDSAHGQRRSPEWAASYTSMVFAEQAERSLPPLPVWVESQKDGVLMLERAAGPGGPSASANGVVSGGSMQAAAALRAGQAPNSQRSSPLAAGGASGSGTVQVSRRATGGR